MARALRKGVEGLDRGALRREPAPCRRRHGGEAHESAVERVGLRLLRAVGSGALDQRAQELAQAELGAGVDGRAIVVDAGRRDAKVRRRDGRGECGKLRFECGGLGAAHQRGEHGQAEATPGDDGGVGGGVGVGGVELVEEEWHVHCGWARLPKQTNATAHAQLYALIVVLDRLHQGHHELIEVIGRGGAGVPERAEEGVRGTQARFDRPVAQVL